MKRIAAYLVMLAVLTALTAQAATPGLINYQGRLLDAGGQPVNATVPVAVALFNAETGGTQVFTQHVGNVTVQNGIYSFAWGTTNLATALTNAECWLQVHVNGTTLTPRQRLISVPYALQAATAATADVARAVADASLTAAALATNFTATMPRSIAPSTYSDNSYQQSEGLHRYGPDAYSKMIMTFQVPEDYVSGDLTLWVTFHPHDTGNGTVARLYADYWRWRKSDGAFAGNSGATVPYTYGQSGRYTITIPASFFSAGDLIWLRLRREAGESADNAGRLDVMAATVEYLGRGR
jgi:hypothetical protein